MSEQALEILFRVFILFDILVALILCVATAFLIGVIIVLLKKIRKEKNKNKKEMLKNG